MATVKKAAGKGFKVRFINNAGGGFAGEVTVPQATTISAFFKTNMKGHSPNNCLIRVNREIATEKLILKAGDRITITPTKVEGA